MLSLDAQSQRGQKWTVTRKRQTSGHSGNPTNLHDRAWYVVERLKQAALFACYGGTNAGRLTYLNCCRDQARFAADYCSTPSPQESCPSSTDPMPAYYLLPCPNCDHRFQLSATQAGQSLTCPKCDASTDAPKLGTLKQLPTEDNATGKSSNGKQSTSGLKRSLFAFGLLLAAVAGIAGVALYLYSQSLYRQVQLDAQVETISQQLDQLDAVQLWDVWHSDRYDEGLGEWREHPVIGYNKQSMILRNFAYGLLGVAVLGLLTLASSFAIKND